MKKYALFLGCTTPTKVLHYELSVRWITRRLKIPLFDIEDLTCCGANQINLSIEGGLLIAAMNLALAEVHGMDLLTVCNGCTGVLTEAAQELRDKEVRKRINKHLSLIGLTYHAKTAVKHFSRVIYEDIGLDRVKIEIQKDLSSLKVAPHYGCHYLKPKSVYDGFDEPDNPRTLHQLIAATGASPIEYETLLHCCGGKTFPHNPDLSLSVAGVKLDNLHNKEIDCLTLQCSRCYLMYGARQQNISDRLGKQFNLPVLLYPQLLGLALGGNPITDLGFHLNAPSPFKILKKWL